MSETWYDHVLSWFLVVPRMSILKIYDNSRKFICENIQKHPNIVIAMRTVQYIVVLSSYSRQDDLSTISTWWCQQWRPTMNIQYVGKRKYLVLYQGGKSSTSLAVNFLTSCLPLLFAKIGNPPILINFMGKERIWDFGDNWIQSKNISFQFVSPSQNCIKNQLGRCRTWMLHDQDIDLVHQTQRVWTSLCTAFQFAIWPSELFWSSCLRRQ